MKKLLLVLSTMVLGISSQVSASIHTCKSPSLHNGKALYVYKVDTIKKYLREYQHTDLGYMQVREITNLRINSQYDDTNCNSDLHTLSIFIFNQNQTYYALLHKYNSDKDFVFIDAKTGIDGYKCETIDEVP